MNKNRYEVFQDFNTKDWIIYDNETNRNIVHCDTEKEAKDFVEQLKEGRR